MTFRCGCPQTPENTRLVSGKYRVCRACENARRNEYRTPERALGGMGRLRDLADGPRCACGLLLPCEHDPESYIRRYVEPNP